MQEMHLYEYAVIRAVPKVERGEFINVGLIMFCKKEKFLKARYFPHEDKLRLFYSELDMDTFLSQLRIFDPISTEKNTSGIQAMDVAERFRWLTAVRSTCIQTSRPHSGLTRDLEKTFELLFNELVM